MAPLEGFSSIPIKLAALISGARYPSSRKPKSSSVAHQLSPLAPPHPKCAPLGAFKSAPSNQLVPLVALALAGHLLLVSSRQVSAWPEGGHSEAALRHHAHYLNIVPSTHFSYSEGRSAPSGSLAISSSDELAMDTAESAHIYKRSSALIAPPAGFVAPVASLHYAPLVGSSHSASGAPISRRMMSDAGQARAWMATSDLDSSPSSANEPAESQERHLSLSSEQHQSDGQQVASARANRNSRNPHQEAELLRQKQHIQYHDQWPSTQGRCHKRTLNFCASVLPFNTTTFPNIIGDTNRFEVKRSLPFFGFLAKSSCNKRLDELLCLLLEPPCQTNTGVAIPPCKKFCRLALEGCNEYIPATLAMSSVFDCRQYPDSNDPQVCINLAQGSKCAADEFKCPDKTCIPRNWLCDGVRDCIFAADEANCTDYQGASGLQASVCSTEEFKCDGKCVPKAWKCDGERDCLDNSDEESCENRPRCGPDRFKCSDGNGCIPKRWVCDGKAECRDGSDETNCEQRQCSEADFKCDNGICIPKLWRCDKQADCKDGSDERNCIYLNASSPAIPALEPPTSGARPTSESTRSDYYATSDLSPSLVPLERQLGADVARIIQRDQQESGNNPETPTSLAPANLSSTTGAPNTMAPSSGSPVPSSSPPPSWSTPSTPKRAWKIGADEEPLDLNRFDYDIIQNQPTGGELPAKSANLAQSVAAPAAAAAAPGEPSSALRSPQTQIDFVPQPTASGSTRMQRASGVQPNQRLANERVPIYRSLFKTLKGAPGKLQAGNNLHGQAPVASGQALRYAVVSQGRRRRDRLSAPDVAQLASGQVHGARTNHSVASYLQLLNGRHNFRLTRVAHQNKSSK